MKIVRIVVQLEEGEVYSEADQNTDAAKEVYAEMYGDMWDSVQDVMEEFMATESGPRQDAENDGIRFGELMKVAYSLGYIDELVVKK